LRFYQNTAHSDYSLVKMGFLAFVKGKGQVTFAKG